ncbi:MAG TPA: hypothetical protein VGC24_08160, partial [Burkholderiaceae bacterium]
RVVRDPLGIVEPGRETLPVPTRQSGQHDGLNFTRVLFTQQFNPDIINHPIQVKSHHDRYRCAFLHQL